jgi:UDP-glucose 4-epimerase
VRDYIHVVDLANAHVRALAWLQARSAPDPFNEVFNLGTGRGTSVLEAITAFEAASGSKLNTVMGQRRPGDVVETYADVTKVTEQLKWRAERSIDDAMADAYRWQVALKQNPL